VIQAHPGGVASLAISADGRYVLTGGLEGVARLWDLGAGASVKTFSHNAHAIVAVALSPDGRLALTGGGGAYANGDFPVEGGDFDIRLWDVDTGKIMRRMSGHTHWVHGLAFSPDGKSAASASLDATVRVWSVADGSEAHCFECGAPGWSVAFLPDNRLVATADDVVLWNLKKVKLLSCLHTGTSPTGVGGVAIVPQSSIVVTGGNDGFVHVWNVESLREAYRFQGHDDSVGTVSAAPDGMFVASAGDDGSIRLWSLEGSPLGAEGHTARPGTAPIPAGAVETSPNAVPAGP
jgi:WD40 repeat protein